MSRIGNAVKRVVRPLWRGFRRLAPGAAARINAKRAARRGGSSLLSDLNLLEERVRSLEREHELMAQHIAILTMRVENGKESDTGDALGDDSRILNSRLGAIAYYEERISKLEKRNPGS
jgi:hypothetical protein